MASAFRATTRSTRCADGDDRDQRHGAEDRRRVDGDLHLQRGAVELHGRRRDLRHDQRDAGRDHGTATRRSSPDTDAGASIPTPPTSSRWARLGRPGRQRAAAASNSVNYTVDTVRPTVSIGINDTALKIGDVATVTFTFSEVPSNFSAADVTYDTTSATLGAITATGNPLVFTASLTPDASITDTTNIITVGTAWQDPAGNARRRRPTRSTTRSTLSARPLPWTCRRIAQRR